MSMPMPEPLSDIRARKRALRREILARILAMDPAERRREEAELIGRVADLPGFAAAGTLLLYVSAFPEEIDTAPILRFALARGQRLACPRVDRAADRLRLHLIEDPARDLEPGTRGIPEPRRDRPAIDPAEVDWSLVPGLAFDAAGFRLGRGKGHYDRLLPTLRRAAPRWALALGPQWVEALPIEPHDQPLDGILGVGKAATHARPIAP